MFEREEREEKEEDEMIVAKNNKYFNERVS